MKMSNQMYDFLKLLGTIILPAVAVFYENIAKIWNAPYSDKIPPTIMAVVVLLNSWLGNSSTQYYKTLANNVRKAEGTLDVEDVDHQAEAEHDSDIG